MPPGSIGAAYDKIAEWFADAPSVEHGRSYLNLFIDHMKPDGRVLDLGCGAGRWSGVLQESGFAVTGVDVSAKLLDIARSRCPRCEWICADAVTFEPVEPFDGVVCWDSLFHLPYAELEPVLRKFAALLRPGGILLYSCGDCDGTIEGEMQGIRFTYAALDEQESRRILQESGFEIIRCDHDQPGEHHLVILARKV